MTYVLTDNKLKLFPLFFVVSMYFYLELQGLVALKFCMKYVTLRGELTDKIL